MEPRGSDNGFERHVVLIHPEIHWNTGNIGRTCLGVGAALHLVKPIGFSLDSKYLRRAGLDYWPRVDLTVWNSFDDFRQAINLQPSEVVLLSKQGRRDFRQMPAPRRLFLVFGGETRGLPAAIRMAYSEAVFHIPISRHIRSLNLSTAVGIALYESLRNGGAVHEWAPDAGGD